jgi:hypothetical protein
MIAANVRGGMNAKWVSQKANVPFHLAFTLRDLVERLNAAQGTD